MFVNEGIEIMSLIEEMRQQKKVRSSEQLDAISTDYLNSLIKEFEKEKKTNKSDSENVLSANQQIADELFVSLNTVKTHLKNINLKLEVDSRIKAVDKAKELGFI